MENQDMEHKKNSRRTQEELKKRSLDQIVTNVVNSSNQIRCVGVA